MTDPRLLQDDSPEISAQLQTSSRNYENERYARANGQGVANYGGLASLNPTVGYLPVSDYQIRHDALKLAINFEGVSDDEIIDIATTFEAYLRGETKIESETVGEGTGG